jgi:hypothetical protein
MIEETCPNTVKLTIMKKPARFTPFIIPRQEQVRPAT